MNTRRIQRALFRMFLDEGFRRRALAGDGLGGFDERERALLMSASPACLSADRDRKRYRQVLGNLVGEYVLSFAVAPPSASERGFPHAFFGTAFFHEAVAADRRLPLAFADYVEGEAGACGDPVFSSFTALEAAMARARRGLRGVSEPGRGEIAVAPGVELVSLPAGTTALAERMRAALDAGATPPETTALGSGADRETAMAVRRPGSNPRALADVAVEVLTPAVEAVLVAAAEAPLGSERRAQIARSRGAEPDDLESFLDSLVEDGVIVRG